MIYMCLRVLYLQLGTDKELFNEILLPRANVLKLFRNKLECLTLSKNVLLSIQFYKTFYVRNLLMFVINWTVRPQQTFPTKSNACEYGLEPTLEWIN
jgi:hypothetical protein